MSTFIQYEGDGKTAYRQVPFSYIEKSHVKVYVNGFPQVDGVHYNWSGPSTIMFLAWAIPSEGTVIEIRRETPLTALVTYQNGATLTAADLNVATRQALYTVEEVVDKYQARLEGGLSRLANGNFTNADEMINAITQEILSSDLLAQLQARISDIDANAEAIIEQTTRVDTLQSVVDHYADDFADIDARIIEEAEARTEGDTALAETIALIGAKSGDGLSFIVDLDSVLVDADTSLGTRLSGIDTRLGTAEAAIVTEQTARASADSSLASSITTLESTVGSNTAALATHATVLDGLTAQYMVKTDVNGRVAGFGLYNDGATSEFVVLANRFAVVDPASPASAPKVPFVISGGVCYLQNVVIQDATIESLTVGKLTSGTMTATITQNADINVGTGRIIYDNGVTMLVHGNGFGVGNEFIEWFGPKMDISACSRNNGTTWKTRNGDAYFGGSLSAGTLTTRAQTSSLASNAEIETPVFGSNGGVIQVTLSHVFGATATNGGSGPTPANQEGSNSTQIFLYRSIGGGPYVHVATLTSTGPWQSTYQGDGFTWFGFHGSSCGGAITFTDPTQSTATRQYKAVRQGGTIKTFINATENQRISLVCVEE